jgi:hypothetical protein
MKNMSGRERPITGALGGESSASGLASVLVTGVSIIAVFVALGVLAEVVSDVAPLGVRLPALLVTLGIGGFGGLYAVLRIRDRLG